jgi:hypothetical protein
MVNTMFGSPEELLRHLVTPLPPSRAKAAELYESFREFGYVARQENTGLTISPRLWGGNLYGALTEVSAEAPGRVPVVMISDASLSDDEFDNWVGIVQGWAAGLPPQTSRAYSSEIKLMQRVEDGIPLPKLHKEMPASLLFSYRRRGDFVIVIDPPTAGKRKIYTTKNIG